jgi:enediyne polyketide synthase
LLAPWLEDLADDHLRDAGLRAALVPGCDRDATSRGAAIAEGRRAVGLQYRPDGKPEIEPGCADSSRAISASHSDDHTLVVTADAAIACDMESVAIRPEGVWRDMLGTERFDLAQRLAGRRGESIDSVATRVWGAQECLRKLGVQRDSPLLCIERDDLPGACALLQAGALRVISLEARVRDSQAPVVITLVARGDDAGV